MRSQPGDGGGDQFYPALSTQRLVYMLREAIPDHKENRPLIPSPGRPVSLQLTLGTNPATGPSFILQVMPTRTVWALSEIDDSVRRDCKRRS